ncbi:MAG: DinB family protein [Candidatus Limnocylindria bacterium]
MGEGERPASVQELVADLQETRGEFMVALGDVDPALLTAPGLVGEWSARELLAHLGYWCGHGAQALHQAAQGTLAEMDPGGPQVQERNDTMARIARETDLATVRAREEASFQALVERLSEADPALLGERIGYGATLELVLREDGPIHYREHTADLRAWFDGRPEPADEDEPAELKADEPGA